MREEEPRKVRPFYLVLLIIANIYEIERTNYADT